MRFVWVAVFACACSNDNFISGDASSATDGAPAPDAASGDASCSSFCAGSNAALCVDFDDGTNWTNLLVSSTLGDGTLDLTQTRSVSCATSLEAKTTTLPSLDAGGSTVNRALATHLFSSLANPHLLVDFDVYLPAPTFVTVFAISPNADVTSGVVIQCDASNDWEFVVHHGGNLTSERTLTAIQPDTWTHMSFDVTLGMNGNPGSATLIYNPAGGAKTTLTITGDSTTDATVTSAKVSLGVDGLPLSSSGVSVDFDNLVVTTP